MEIFWTCFAVFMFLLSVFFYHNYSKYHFPLLSWNKVAHQGSYVTQIKMYCTTAGRVEYE